MAWVTVGAMTFVVTLVLMWIGVSFVLGGAWALLRHAALRAAVDEGVLPDVRTPATH